MPTGIAATAKPLPLEPHYTVGEIAERLSLSVDRVRDLFFDEPGVLKIGRASRLMGGRAKKLIRHYYQLRIPESVLLRVQDGLMNKRPPARSASAFSGSRVPDRADDLHAS